MTVDVEPLKAGTILRSRPKCPARSPGIEPTFITYDGDDPDGYALMVNIARRHMTKGQQAMVAARALRILQDEKESGRKPTSFRQTGKTLSMSHERIVAANMVLDYAPPSPTASSARQLCRPPRRIPLPDRIDIGLDEPGRAAEQVAAGRHTHSARQLRFVQLAAR